MDGLIWQFSITNGAFTLVTTATVMRAVMVQVRREMASAIRALSTSTIEQRMADEVRLDGIDHRMTSIEHQVAEIQVLLETIERRYRRMARVLGATAAP